MLVTRSTLHLRLPTMQESNVTESVQSFNVTMSLDDLNAEEAQIFLPAAIFVSILSVIGVISNIHIILIYGLRMERSSNRNFIIALAILDLIASMLAMPFVVATSILPYKFTDATACKVLAMVSYFSTTASGFILVMIAVDRYRHICRPMGRQMSKTLVTISCLLSVGLAILLTWPSLIFYDVNDVQIKYTNVTGKECAFSSKFRRSSYVRIYNYVLLGVSMILFIILVVLYICIHRSISKHEKYLEKFIIHKPHKSNMRKGFAQSVDTLNDSLFDTTCSHDDTIFTKSEKQYVDSPDSKLKENESSGLKADVYPLRRINTISEEDTREIVEEDTSFNNALQRNLEENEKPLPTSLNRAPYDVNNTSQTKVSNQNGDASLVQVLEQPNKNRERNSFDSVLTDDTNRDGRKYRSESSVRAFFHQKKSTFMFIIITVVFLCGYVFHELLILTVTLVPDIHENMSRSVRSLYYTSLWLVFINNVCNSAIYGYFHRRFREELKEFYRSIFCRN